MDNIDTDDLKIAFTRYAGPTYTHSNDLFVFFSSLSYKLAFNFNTH